MPVGLAPTPRSSFAVHLPDHAALDTAPLLRLPFNGDVDIRGYSAINQPNCQVIVEDFLPGSSFDWTFTHDEFQVAIAGEMQLTVWLPPLYADKVETRITPGMVYTFPLGARMHVEVVGDRPYRHLCLCPPSPDYPFPTLDDLKAGGPDA